MNPFSIGSIRFSKLLLEEWIGEWLEESHSEDGFDTGVPMYTILGTDCSIQFPAKRFCSYIGMYIKWDQGCSFATCPSVYPKNSLDLWCYFYCGSREYMWRPPLNKKFIGVTNDSMSFQRIDMTNEIEIPVGQHVGAFGSVRKFDVHKGIDLYAKDGEEVFAVEDGIVTNIRPFTGEKCESPWWNNTDALSISGWSGNVVYGEIEIDSSMKLGKEVKAGEKIGVIRTVLKKDKGRPMSMLHLAVHKHGIQTNGCWEIGDTQPVGLIDPSIFLTSLFIR